MGPDMLTPITEEEEEEFRKMSYQQDARPIYTQPTVDASEDIDIERLEKIKPPGKLITPNQWRSSLTSLGNAPKQRKPICSTTQLLLEKSANSSTADVTIPLSSSRALTDITSYTLSLSPIPSASSPSSLPTYNRNPSLSRKQREIRRVLLLNAYPIAYVILWTPGIANRIVELTGHSSRVLNILQSSTQFIGLANAITYGCNENIKRQVRGWLGRERERR